MYKSLTSSYIVLSFLSLFCNSASFALDTECEPLGSDYGGDWHCWPPVENVLDPVEDGTMCVLACYNTDIEAVTCTAGAWSPHPPGEAACHLCPPLSVPDHAVMTCSEAYIGPNTTCSLECDSEDLYFTGEWKYSCGEDGVWREGDITFSCQARLTQESLLVVGGLLDFDTSEYTDIVDKMTGIMVTNTSVPPLPSGGAGYLTATGLGSRAVACFGSMSSSDIIKESECLIWDNDATDWFNPREDANYRPPEILKRTKADSVTLNDKVWIIGGRHENYSMIVRNTVEIFNPSCVGESDCQYWIQGPEMPTPAYSTCTVAYQGDLYLTGGYTDAYRPPYSSYQVVKFESDSGSWTELPDMPGERYGHGCSVMEGELYISGGESFYDFEAPSILTIMNIDSLEWRMGGILLTPRHNHGMVNLNGILTVIGGAGRKENEEAELDSIEEYHSDVRRWKTRNIKLSQPKRFFGAAVISS